jgi:hypothetical protein
MADASPPKWHLGHTSWFYEEFLLKQPELSALVAPYEPSDSRWGYLFNSYYDAVGARHPRPERGLLTRPALGELLAWRQRVSAALERLLVRLDGLDPQQAAAPLALVELAAREQRDVTVVCFDQTVRPEGVFAFPQGQAPIQEKLRLASYFTGGGTNWELPVRAAAAPVRARAARSPRTHPHDLPPLVLQRGVHRGHGDRVNQEPPAQHAAPAGGRFRAGGGAARRPAFAAGRKEVCLNPDYRAGRGNWQEAVSAPAAGPQARPGPPATTCGWSAG